MTEAVILVPGIMGSVLMDGVQVIWPGSPLELLLPYKHMKELLKPDLRATDVIRSLSISPSACSALAPFLRILFEIFSSDPSPKRHHQRHDEMFAKSFAHCSAGSALMS